MKLCLFEQHKKTIISHAQTVAPIEACGYLAGTIVSAAIYDVEQVFMMQNTDESREHFTFDPQEQFAVLKAARAKGLSLIGVYHSHPESPALPSQEDIRLAYDPNMIYVIVSLMNDATDLKAFSIKENVVTSASIDIT